jgi:hypothetical protein
MFSNAARPFFAGRSATVSKIGLSVFAVLDSSR